MQNTSRSPRKRSKCWASRAVSGTAVGSRLSARNLSGEKEAGWWAGWWAAGGAGAKLHTVLPAGRGDTGQSPSQTTLALGNGSATIVDRAPAGAHTSRKDKTQRLGSHVAIFPLWASPELADAVEGCFGQAVASCQACCHRVGRGEGAPCQGGSGAQGAHYQSAVAERGSWRACIQQARGIASLQLRHMFALVGPASVACRQGAPVCID